MNIQESSLGNLNKLSSIFGKFFVEIAHMYPPKMIQDFIDWHSQDQFVEKIHDPTRFFRIIQDKNSKIIAYFESKQNSVFSEVQVVQWIFVHHSYRRRGISTELWAEFLVWCKGNGYKTVWSYVSLSNEISQRVHATLMTSHARGTTGTAEHGQYLYLYSLQK